MASRRLLRGAKQIPATSNCTEKAAERRVEEARAHLRIILAPRGSSCVFGTEREEECRALEKNLYCLKWLYPNHLQRSW